MLSMSVPSDMILWIIDYLTSRSQFVVFQSLKSDTLYSNTGVSQGTVLAPLLFSLYTSDCRSSNESCSIVKYADDTVLIGLASDDKVLIGLSSDDTVLIGLASDDTVLIGLASDDTVLIGLASDDTVLIGLASDDTVLIGLASDDDSSKYVDEINKFVTYCNTNLLELNVEKTKEIIIDFRKSKAQPYPIIINDHTVVRVSICNYLRIMLNNDLSWSNNTDYIISKLNSRLYCLRKFKKFNINIYILKLFYQLVNKSVFMILLCLLGWKHYETGHK